MRFRAHRQPTYAIEQVDLPAFVSCARHGIVPPRLHSRIPLALSATHRRKRLRACGQHANLIRSWAGRRTNPDPPPRRREGSPSRWRRRYLASCQSRSAAAPRPHQRRQRSRPRADERYAIVTAAVGFDRENLTASALHQEAVRGPASPQVPSL